MDAHSFSQAVLAFIRKHKLAMARLRDADVQYRMLTCAAYFTDDQSLDISVPLELCRELLELDIELDAEVYRYSPSTSSRWSRS